MLIDKFANAAGSNAAALLKEERVKRKLSLKKLAEKSGVARQTISYIEKEVQSPSLDTLLRITAAMDVDLGEIITTASRRIRKK